MMRVLVPDVALPAPDVVSVTVDGAGNITVLLDAGTVDGALNVETKTDVLDVEIKADDDLERGKFTADA